MCHYRKLEDLQADLSTSTQKWHNLNNQHETAMREKEREIEALNSKLEETRSSLTGDLQDVVSLAVFYVPAHETMMGI